MKRRKTGGRIRGTPNKLTRSAKMAFQFAFDANGGQEALARWAEGNPTDFYRLYARLIPVDITSTDDEIDAVEVTIVRNREPARGSTLRN